MNENLNLCEILKDCQRGTKLYSPLYGDVEFCCVDIDNADYPIIVEHHDKFNYFTQDGRFNYAIKEQDCLLFPSKDVRTWDNFKPNKPKFHPKTLHPFDRVIVRTE